MKETKNQALDRRSFFKKAGLGAGAAGAAAVLAVSGEAEASEPVRSASAAGYRETDHVKKYYELSRF